ncbi:MAG: condensation domain-containing protein, partial [Sandaracinaceae bacterium]|nr:condensation domain-containing protein [Sandaracinaceae bacterium]
MNQALTKPQGVSDEYPATPLQVGMVLNSERSPSKGVEIEQVVIELERPVKIDELQSAFEQVSQRHPVLRSAFRWEVNQSQPTLIQYITASAPIEITHIHPQDFERFLLEDRQRGFELHRPPLQRVTLIDTQGDGDGDCFIWTFHHAIL